MERCVALVGESLSASGTPCLWCADVANECIYLLGVGASTLKLCATFPLIGSAGECARKQVGGTPGGPKRGKFPECSLGSLSKLSLR